MNVTDLFYTVFSVIFLEQNTRQIPHRFNQQHYQYNTNSDTTLIQDQGKQKTEDYSKFSNNETFLDIFKHCA